MEQFDLNEFAKMFDAALASNNPSVKKSLRNFMMIAAIVHAEEQPEAERLMGPLETLVKKVNELERIVYTLQSSNKTKTYYDHNTYNNPTWIYQSPTSVTSTSSGTGKTWHDYNYNNLDIQHLLKELKFDDTK